MMPTMCPISTTMTINNTATTTASSNQPLGLGDGYLSEDELHHKVMKHVDHNFSIWASYRQAEKVAKEFNAYQASSNSRESMLHIIKTPITTSPGSTSGLLGPPLALATITDNGDEKSSSSTSGRALRRGSSIDRDVLSTTELTVEEARDIEKWRKRFIQPSTTNKEQQQQQQQSGASILRKFDRGYIPQKYERKELTDLIQYLELKNPHKSAQLARMEDDSDDDDVVSLGVESIMSYFTEDSDSEDGDDDAMDDRTKNAIRKIFFPKLKEQQSVLIKRGELLLAGEVVERELILLTTGFVLVHMEMDTFVDLLLDVNTVGGGDSYHNRDDDDEDFVINKLIERFNEIDTDMSGSLDRQEVMELFGTIGMTLSTETLDNLFKQLDTDRDGTIDLDEFKAMLKGAKEPQKQESKGGRAKRGMSWIQKAIMGSRKEQKQKSKLDVAYRMSEVDRIVDDTTEKKNNNGDSDNGGSELDSDFCAPQTLSLSIYLKKVEKPLVMTCSKPGQKDAWLEAFEACKEQPRKVAIAKFGTTIDWGDDSDSDLE